MRIRRRMLAGALLILGLMLAVTCLAQEEKTLDEQRAEKIEERIQKAYEAWCRKPQDASPSYSGMIREVFDTLSEEDIRIAAQHLHSIGVEVEAFRRWARFDPAGALKAVRVFEDANAAKMRRPGLEAGPGEAMEMHVFGMYFGVFDGWSKVAAKEAWMSFKTREGPLADSLVIENYAPNFYEMFFERLAKIEPDFAFKEFMEIDLGDYEELSGVDILKGYLRGAPRGRDWEKELEQSFSREMPRSWRFYSVIRINFMGRWLEDDQDAAEKWFKQSDIEGLNWSYPTIAESYPFAATDVSVQRKRERHHLWSAAGYWAARDFLSAWRWMKSSGSIKEEGFAPAVFDGMIEFYGRERWGDQRARLHCLDQVPKLPDQADRDQFVLQFAHLLWVFDDTHFPGDPIPDRSKWLVDVRARISTLGLSSKATEKVISILEKDLNREQE